MKNLQKWDIDFLTGKLLKQFDDVLISKYVKHLCQLAGYIFKFEQGFEDYIQENVMSCIFIAEFIVLWTASRIF